MENLPPAEQPVEYFNATRARAETRPALVENFLGWFMLLAGIFFAILFLISIAVAVSKKDFSVLLASAICGFACFASVFVGFPLVRRRMSK
jgi:hypothetical protein